MVDTVCALGVSKRTTGNLKLNPWTYKTIHMILIFMEKGLAAGCVDSSLVDSGRTRASGGQQKINICREVYPQTVRRKE